MSQQVRLKVVASASVHLAYTTSAKVFGAQRVVGIHTQGTLEIRVIAAPAERLV